MSVLKEWRTALDDGSAFELLLRSSWLPVVRRVVSTEWEPRRNCENLLNLLEVWQSLLPQDLLQHDILDSVVLPRLVVSLYFFLLSLDVSVVIFVTKSMLSCANTDGS